VTGAAGTFEAVGRIIGSSIQLDTGLRRWTVLLGGYLTSLSLCPSAEISAFTGAPPAATDTLDIPIKYYKHFKRVLDEDGPFDLTLYNPGVAELASDPFGYTINAVTEVAGPLCRLTISALLDGAESPTANISRVTTPKGSDSSAYQSAHLMHDGDGSSWSPGT
jgi:hypothetical protein